jgi:hypothetical protein
MALQQRLGLLPGRRPARIDYFDFAALARVIAKKLQIPKKRKVQTLAAAPWIFETWSLVLLWGLELGIWDFPLGTLPPSAHAHLSLLRYHPHHWQGKAQPQFLLQVNLYVMQPELLKLHSAKVVHVGGVAFHFL